MELDKHAFRNDIDCYDDSNKEVQLGISIRDLHLEYMTLRSSISQLIDEQKTHINGNDLLQQRNEEIMLVGKSKKKEIESLIEEKSKLTADNISSSVRSY